jgi:hypothetical protein
MFPDGSQVRSGSSPGATPRNECRDRPKDATFDEVGLTFVAPEDDWSKCPVQNEEGGRPNRQSKCEPHGSTLGSSHMAHNASLRQRSAMTPERRGDQASGSTLTDTPIARISSATRELPNQLHPKGAVSGGGRNGLTARSNAAMRLRERQKPLTWAAIPSCRLSGRPSTARLLPTRNASRT